MNLFSRRGRLIAGAALLLLALAALVAWRWRPQEVDALTLTARPLARTLQFSARVQTPRRVDIGATVTGRVVAVPVREGDAVAAGAALIQLESDEARAALAQAEASLQQANARLASQQAVALPGAEAALAQAEATLLVAEREWARTRELVDRQFVSAARLDEARRALDVARAQRDSARVAAQAQQPQGAESRQAQAQLDAARAAVLAARARLDQMTLRAPAAGRVLVRSVEPGQIVQPGRALLGLGVDGPLEMVALVDERFLGQLQADQTATVVADAYPGQAFAARVARLAPAVDAQRGAIDVRLVLAGERPPFLREDMTLSVEVVTGQRAAARVLPIRVLRAAPEGDRAQVLVAPEGRVELRSVRLGLRTLDQVEIVDGLVDGESVLANPALEPGQRVRLRVVPAAAGGASTALSRDMAGGQAMPGFGR